MVATVLLVALVQHPAAPADTAAGRPCKMIIDSVGRQAQQVEVRRGETNVFAGGGVLAHCEGTSSTLASDSVAWFAGVKRFDMLGQKNPVHIRDTAMTLDATTAAYFMGQERLEAHKNVIAVNRKTGSVLRGPNLTYYRAVRGVRDTLEMYASGRPTIEYHTTADTGGGEPYLIVADRVRLAPHGGYDPPAPRPEEAAAGVRLGAQGLGPRTGRVDAQHDRLRFTRPRSPGRSAHRGARLWTRPFDLDQGVPEAGLHGDRRRRLVRGGFAHGTLDTGPRLGGDAEDQAESGHRPGLGPLLHASGESARLHGPVAELLPRQGHRLHPEGRQGRPVHGHWAGQRRPAGAQAAGPRHDEEGRHDQSDGHDEKETRPMTAPVSSPHLADLMAARDSSLPLAAAALARVADEQGHAPFSELAIAYREEFLTLRAHSREAGLPELGGLSVEEFRTSLRTSVLPRLALMKVVTYAAAALEDAAPIAFTVEAWEEIGADRAASADRLLGAAEHALTRAESASGEHPVVRGGSRLTATGLLKAYKGRSVVNDVSVQLDQGEIVGLLGPNGRSEEHTSELQSLTNLVCRLLLEK